MIVVASTGANLPRELTTRLNIALPEQIVMIDGEPYGVDAITLRELDTAMKTAKVYPYQVSASAADFVATLNGLIAKDKDFLILTGSRHMLAGFESATAAVRLLMQQPGFRMANIRVVDTGLSEIAVGLVAVRCAAAIKGGASPSEVMDICHSMLPQAAVISIPHTLEAARNSGRATFLRTFAANVMKVLPVLYLSGGEVKQLKTVPSDCDKAAVIAELAIQRIGAGKKVWVGIHHGDVATQAFDLEQKLRAAFDVRFLLNRPSSLPLFVVTGMGFLGCNVLPVDDRFSGPP